VQSVPVSGIAMHATVRIPINKEERASTRKGEDRRDVVSRTLVAHSSNSFWCEDNGVALHALACLRTPLLARIVSDAAQAGVTLVHQISCR